MKHWIFWAWNLGIAAGAFAGSPWRVPVDFSYTQDAGTGYSLFVTGSHPDLGSWNPLNAVMLTWHEGNVWSNAVALQAGTAVEYRFIKRSTAADQIASENNVEWLGEGNLQISTAGEPEAPYSGKRVVFLCDWDEPVNFVYSMLSKADYEATNEWQVASMTQTAPGRFEVDGIGEEGEWMRFTMSGYSGGEQVWYHFYGSTHEDFYTPLDAFCVKDGQIFNYEPTGTVADSTIVTTNVGSSESSIPGRDIRIYLPRGYAAHTNRSYPVVYFTDGQNVFSPGGAYGCWNAETSADREIRGGRMRECILVAVPCREGSVIVNEIEIDARRMEYLPGTGVNGSLTLTGNGEAYANFLIHNVRPTVDAHYRTKNDYANTAAIGSSAGGLMSMYLGVHTNVFGLIGAMSGVYNASFCTEFRAEWENKHAKSGRKVWLDTGTEETQIEGLDLYASNLEAYGLLVNAGHVPGKDLQFMIGAGPSEGAHNEAAWAERLPMVYDFLLDVREEPNPLLPLRLTVQESNVTFPVYDATTYELFRADDLRTPENTHTAWTSESRTEKPWGTTNVAIPAPGFYWLRGK